MSPNCFWAGFRPPFQIFAELAIVPESVACTKPNAALINTLRTALLQVKAVEGLPERPNSVSKALQCGGLGHEDSSSKNYHVNHSDIRRDAPSSM